MDVRIVFMGSPEFALPSLKGLNERYNVVGVVTQPDRPAGRGRALTPPPVKTMAQDFHIPVIQPRRLKEPEAMDQLRAWNPELIVVAAFGQILRPEALNLPRYGSINVHASLLPRWRGAAPIQAAILHGDEQTGVTIMKMDPGMDTGPVLSHRAIPIISQDTARSLAPRLAQLGAELLLETLPAYLQGDLQPKPQEDDQATLAPMLKKEDGELDFTRPAQELARQVRAFNPWPSAFTSWENNRLIIHRAHAVEKPSIGPGKHTVVGGAPGIGAAEGILVLDEVQPAGKRSMRGEVFLNGAKGWA